MLDLDAKPLDLRVNDSHPGQYGIDLVERDRSQQARAGWVHSREGTAGSTTRDRVSELYTSVMQDHVLEDERCARCRRPVLGRRAIPRIAGQAKHHRRTVRGIPRRFGDGYDRPPQFHSCEDVVPRQKVPHGVLDRQRVHLEERPSVAGRDPHAVERRLTEQPG